MPSPLAEILKRLAEHDPMFCAPRELNRLAGMSGLRADCHSIVSLTFKYAAWIDNDEPFGLKSSGPASAEYKKAYAHLFAELEQLATFITKVRDQYADSADCVRAGTVAMVRVLGVAGIIELLQREPE